MIRFESDSEKELELLRSMVVSAGAEDAVVANHWAEVRYKYIFTTYKSFLSLKKE